MKRPHRRGLKEGEGGDLIRPGEKEEKIQLIGRVKILSIANLQSLHFSMTLKVPTIDVVSSPRCSGCDEEQLHELLMMN